MDKGSEVVARYVAAVEAHTNASASGDYRAANRAHDEIVKVYWRIRFSGNLDEVLSPLLRHDNPAVVLWAGTQLLCTGNALALRALEDVARRTDTHQAAYARLALEEWRAGRLELAPLESATSPVRELDAVQAEFLPKDTRYELLGKYHVPSGTLAIVGYVESHGSAIEIAGTLESGGYPINLQLDRLNQLIGVDFNTPKEEWKTLSVFPAIPAQRSAGGLRFAPEIFRWARSTATYERHRVCVA